MTIDEVFRVVWMCEHWLMAAGLLIAFLLYSAVEAARWVRIAGKFALELIRELKHEVTGARDVGRQVKDELQRWSGNK